MASKVWRNSSGLTLEELKAPAREESPAAADSLPWAQLEFRLEKGHLDDVVVIVNGEAIGRLAAVRASLDAAPEGCTWVVRALADQADVHRTGKP